MIEPRTSPSSFIDLPDGLSLPGLPVLMVPARMEERIAWTLPSRVGTIVSCQPVNFRYRTRECCTIAYELRVRRTADEAVETHLIYARAYSPSEYASARLKAEGGHWTDSGLGTTIGLLDDLFAILYWYPNDERLDGLRRIVNPKKLQRLFHAHLVEYPVERWRISDHSVRLSWLRYKPERRAVLRCRFRAHDRTSDDAHERFVIIGVYEGGRAQALAQTTNAVRGAAAVHASLLIPAALACVPEDGVLVFEEATGSTLRSIMLDGTWDKEIAEAAKALAIFHQLPVPIAPSKDADPETRLRDSLRLVAELAPDCAAQAQSVMDSILQQAPRSAVHTESLVHGDFHSGQVICGTDRTALVDFDRIHKGDPLEDLGNFCAQLHPSASGVQYDDAESMAARLVSVYEDAVGASVDYNRLRWWTAVSLLRSCLVSLGRMEPDWRKQAKALIRAAKEQLG